MATSFVVGPGIAQAMADDGTQPASDEIFVHGSRPQPQWSQAMGENGTTYRWLRATNRVYRYAEGRRASSLAAKLQSVVDLGFSKGHRRYAGPVIGEPESFRDGDPGYDCSSFVSLMYRDALGIQLTKFTDAMAGQTDEIPTADALPGDIVLFRYHDPEQPGVTFPHTGLWLGGGRMLDCQFGPGLGEHPLLGQPFEIHRARGL
ncbi:MAG TPA: NlpC/P60 family protein [Chloroflexota bacterium]|nr:NlpC/P60 family protein [Chloroflexota bacterium]